MWAQEAENSGTPLATTARLGHSCLVDSVELAQFLRSRRVRLTPLDVGLRANGRRRTPGLRREEVAHLAGISTDYYMRLEQSRGSVPSRQVLTALAQALRLTRDERDYLLRLAGVAPAPAHEREVPPGVRAMLDRLDVPATVLDAKYDILGWNSMAAMLMTGIESVPARERNTLRWVFRQHRSWLTSADGQGFARKCVADLRTSGRYPEDPEVRTLVNELSADFPDFAEIWAGYEVAAQRTAIKRTVHPIVGPLELHCEMLLIPGTDQRMMMYTAEPGSPSHSALQRLRDLTLKQAAS